MILKIVNDCLQGSVSGIGFFFAGTDDFLNDTRRGIASNEALRSRLAENFPKREGIKGFIEPVIFLNNLSIEDTYVLLQNIRTVFAKGEIEKFLITDEGIEEFLQYCARTLGIEFYQTPRDMVRKYVSMLSLLELNPGKTWKDIVAPPLPKKEGVASGTSSADPSSE